MLNQYLTTIPVVLGIIAVGAFLSNSALGQTAMEKPLYERLGCYDAVSAVVDDFAGKLFNDPIVGVRFFGMSKDSREGFRQKNKNLICNVTGGPARSSVGRRLRAMPDSASRRASSISSRSTLSTR